MLVPDCEAAHCFDAACMPAYFQDETQITSSKLAAFVTWQIVQEVLIKIVGQLDQVHWES